VDGETLGRSILLFSVFQSVNHDRTSLSFLLCFSAIFLMDLYLKEYNFAIFPVYFSETKRVQGASQNFNG